MYRFYKIDQPFYEDMYKVASRLSHLSIQNYTMTNTVGFKSTRQVQGYYNGQPTGIHTEEYEPETITVNNLYSVASPYKTSLQASYKEFKKSKAYKKNQLTEDEYVTAMHNTRALAGATLTGLDVYSAASGKDWGTGRELDGTERGLRAGFALFDLIPAGKYLGGLAKTGKEAGVIAVKDSVKTTFKKGLEQGASNLAHFKGFVKNAKGFGGKVFNQIKGYGKQLDNFARDKVISVADNLAGKLRQADEVISDAAQNFRLNFCMEPQLVSGAIPSTYPGRLSGMADNLQAFAKNLDGGVDEVVRGVGGTGKLQPLLKVN